MSHLPGILALIAEIAGEQAATRLALAAGGTEMKFSARPNAALARIVGAAAAAKIVEGLGSEKYIIPMAHLRGQKGRRAQAAAMLREGKSHNEVAKACDMHERTARRVTEKLKREAGEPLPLFPDDPA
ncbi:MAG: helix-turn-helix domain-containing protein [Phenylobacterium sp.]|nr:helix-turn-helix domain-containing protein [Phenylobacterium sp.]